MNDISNSPKDQTMMHAEDQITTKWEGYPAEPVIYSGEHNIYDCKLKPV